MSLLKDLHPAVRPGDLAEVWVAVYLRPTPDTPAVSATARVPAHEPVFVLRTDKEDRLGFMMALVVTRSGVGWVMQRHLEPMT